MIKYDITLTMLSFYIFGNVLPRDIASKILLFVLANFGKFLKPRWRRIISREGLVTKFGALFAKYAIL